MRSVTLHQLRLFASAARHASFAAAARELHLTQPAVSMQIRELEETVGLPLFDRSARRVSLTTPGEYFLVYARRMLATLKDAEDTMARMRGAETGRLIVGMVTTAADFLPRMLSGFLREHPGVEVELVIGNRRSLVELLHRNEVDLAVMGTPPRELDTRAVPFAPHPIAAFASPSHPLAGRPHLPAQLLANERFIVREDGSGTRAAMEVYLRTHRIRPHYAMQVASNEAVKHAVSAGLGVAFLSMHTVRLALAAGELAALDVEGLPMMRAWHVVQLRARTLSPAAEAFRYSVIESGERFLDELFGPVLRAALPARPARVSRSGSARSTPASR
jgi:DNA-binding transcriptional LysR family regulator